MTSVTLETYGKAVIVKGDTRPLKDFLKAKGGRWLNKESAWMFQGSKKAQVLADLRGNPSVANVVDKTSTEAQAATSSSTAASSSSKRKMGNESAPTSSSGDGKTVDLGGSVLCSINCFQGKKGVDVRRMWQDGDDLKPTAKGIRFGEDEWKTLHEHADQIDVASKEKKETKIELADLSIITINGQGGDRIDMRKWYVDKADGEKKPTKKGVSLSVQQWEKLRQNFSKIDAMYQEMPVEASEKPAKAAKVTEEDDSSALSKKSLKKKITAFLEGKDLAEITPKVLRRELEKEMKMPEGGLDAHKAKINDITQKVMQAMQAEEPSEAEEPPAA